MQPTKGTTVPRTVLFSPETFNLAEVTRAVEVARRMPPDITCVFSGYSRRYESHILDAGFSYHRITPELTDDDADALLALDQGRGWRNPLNRDVMAERVRSERTLIQQTGARAVVIGTTLSQLISARAEGVPLAYVKPFAYSLPHVRQMRRTGFFQRKSLLSRLVDNGIATLARNLVDHITVKPPGWSAVARANGVHLCGPTLGLLEADLNLITTPRAFLPEDLDLPSSYRVVGPIYAHLDAEVPAMVHELARAPKPLVYVAAGSSGGRDLVMPILRGLGGAPVNVISPVERLLTRADRSALARNVHVTGWLPVHLLGDAVDLAVTHGGEGTVQASIANGWPMIGVPLQLEQRFNLMRCVDYGNARIVSRRRAAGTDWRELVSQVLRDAQMHERSTTAAKTAENWNGPALAADLIARLV